MRLAMLLVLAIGVQAVGNLLLSLGMSHVSTIYANVFTRWVVCALVVVTSIGLSPASGQSAGSAGDRIGSLYGVLIETMQHASQLGIKGRFDRLAPVLVDTYDIPSMSRTAVGQSWGTLNSAQQAGIVDAFTRMRGTPRSKARLGNSADASISCKISRTYGRSTFLPIRRSPTSHRLHSA